MDTYLQWEYFNRCNYCAVSMMDVTVYEIIIPHIAELEVAMLLLLLFAGHGCWR